MGPRNTKTANVHNGSIKFFIITSGIIFGSFSLILGMCLVFASAVAQFERFIGGVLESLVGYPLLSSFAMLSGIAVGLLALIVTAAWGELAWLLLERLGLLLSGGAL
jgi:hypothetical protein